MSRSTSLFDEVLDGLDPDVQEHLRMIVRRLETRIVLLTGERDELAERASQKKDALKLRDVRQLLTQIIAHEDHYAVQDCVPVMVDTAKAAITIIDSERWGE